MGDPVFFFFAICGPFFVRGAAGSKGGRSIIAMPSTVKGKISKIVPLLDEGARVRYGQVLAVIED